jgi:hypothetical protein
MMTDGFGASFVFARRKPQEETHSNVFDLEDFHSEEIKEHFLPCALDPGRRQVFTATVSHSPEELEVRRYSTKGRPCYAGTIRRSRYIDKMKIRLNIKEIETDIPTSKTVNKEKCKERFRYVLDHLPLLFEFYSFKSAFFKIPRLSRKTEIQCRNG